MYFYFDSTISSTVNALAANVLEEFIRPWKPDLSEKKATIITKVVSLVMGGLAIVLVLFARYFGRGILSVSVLIISFYARHWLVKVM